MEGIEIVLKMHLITTLVNAFHNFLILNILIVYTLMNLTRYLHDILERSGRKIENNIAIATVKMYKYSPNQYISN